MKTNGKALSSAYRYITRWLWRRQRQVATGHSFVGPDGWAVTDYQIVLPYGPGFAAIRHRYRAQRPGKPRAPRFVRA